MLTSGVGAGGLSYGCNFVVGIVGCGTVWGRYNNEYDSSKNCVFVHQCGVYLTLYKSYDLCGHLM